MELLRIGEKVIDRTRVYRVVDKILELRASGLSQQEVANKLEIDRTFVSRLESIGEVRKGRKIGLVGFPVRNRGELEAVAREEGLDLVWLMTEAERQAYIRSKNGADLLNEIMALITRARECDSVIFLGSDMRIGLVEAILGQNNVIGIEIGPSPITEDKYVNPEQVRSLIRSLREG